MLSILAEALFEEFCPGIRYAEEDKVFYEQAVRVMLKKLKQAPDDEKLYNRYADICDKTWKNLNSKEVLHLWIDAIIKE